MRALAYILSLHVLVSSVGWSVYTHTCMESAVSITSVFRTGCGESDAAPHGCCKDAVSEAMEEEGCCTDELRFYTEPPEAVPVSQYAVYQAGMQLMGQSLPGMVPPDPFAISSPRMPRGHPFTVSGGASLPLLQVFRC